MLGQYASSRGCIRVCPTVRGQPVARRTTSSNHHYPPRAIGVFVAPGPLFVRLEFSPALSRGNPFLVALMRAHPGLELGGSVVVAPGIVLQKCGLCLLFQ